MSNQRFWQPPVQRYIAECVQGTDGVREKNFNMRWIASLVAEVYRILTRGGCLCILRYRDPVKQADYVSCTKPTNGIIIEQAVARVQQE